ncbi:MAG: hypothetical protein J5852_00850 [Clostridia bacterium]|nr:hypothetical protein [Clostridia bacterium]
MKKKLKFWLSIVMAIVFCYMVNIDTMHEIIAFTGLFLLFLRSIKKHPKEWELDEDSLKYSYHYRSTAAVNYTPPKKPTLHYACVLGCWRDDNGNCYNHMGAAIPTPVTIVNKK